jgi:hypothetical protein
LTPCGVFCQAALDALIEQQMDSWLSRVFFASSDVGAPYIGRAMDHFLGLARAGLCPLRGSKYDVLDSLFDRVYSGRLSTSSIGLAFLGEGVAQTRFCICLLRALVHPARFAWKNGFGTLVDI